MSPLRQRGSYLQHLDVEDERLRVLLQGVQVRVTQGAVFVHLSNSTAMPLALQGVLALSDVAEALGHQRIQDYMLQEGSRGAINVGRCSLGTRSLTITIHTGFSTSGFFLFFPLLFFVCLFVLIFLSSLGWRWGFGTEFLHVSLTILELIL